MTKKNFAGEAAPEVDENGEKIIRVIGAENPLIKWDENDESVKTANAGIVLTLTNKFFDDYNSILMDLVTDNLDGMAIDDYCTEQGLGTLVTGHLCVKN